jgi:hypothetical protein
MRQAADQITRFNNVALRFTTGTRVATRKTEGEPMVTGMFEPGATGTIVSVEDGAFMDALFFIRIKLDEYNDNLDEWDNELHLLIDRKHNDPNKTIGERLRVIDTLEEECDGLPTV